MEQNELPNIPASVTSKRLPNGLIIILCYIFYSIVTTLWTFQVHYLFLGPFVFGEAVSIVFKLASTVILIICLVGLWKKNYLGWRISIYWFYFGIFHMTANVVLSLLFFRITVENFALILPQNNPISAETTVLISLLFGFVTALLINGFIIRYLYKQRRLFMPTAVVEEK
jgi:hypothetical protein